MNRSRVPVMPLERLRRVRRDIQTYPTVPQAVNAQLQVARYFIRRCLTCRPAAAGECQRTSRRTVARRLRITTGGGCASGLPAARDPTLGGQTRAGRA
jgi:hypothetical protein